MLKKFFTAATVIEQACTIALLRKLVSVYEHRVRTLTASNGVLRATNEVQKEKLRDNAGEREQMRKAHAALTAAAGASGVKMDLSSAGMSPAEFAADFAAAVSRTEPTPHVASWDPPAPPASRESKL